MHINAQAVLVILRLVCLKDLICNYSLILKHPIVIVIVLICFNYANALIMTDNVLYRPINIKLIDILQPNEAAVCVCCQSLNRLIFAQTLSVVRRYQSEVGRPN